MFVASETNSNVCGRFVCQLPKFFLQFEQQTVGVHKFFFFCWVIWRYILFKVSYTLYNFVFANNEVFLTDLF